MNDSIKIASIAVPVFILLLGDFRLLRHGEQVLQRGGNGKAGFLLSLLALQPGKPMSRSYLLEAMWPNEEGELAGQSLNSLVHSLRKLLSQAMGGESPVVVDGSTYALNVAAGIGIDVGHFDAEVDAGERAVRTGDWPRAMLHSQRALTFYRGDLLPESALDVVIERERLRGRYLSVLGRLAEWSFGEGDYGVCLNQAHRMLASDPCREDAHRLIMRCHVRRNERAQALRQFVLCRDVLQSEFEAQPEAETAALYEQIRLDPSKV